jgi:Tfp pilus assembly protein PilN
VKAVNLLPDQPKRRAPRSAKPVRAYAVLGVLGALLVMAVVYTLTTNQVKSRTADAAEARASAEQLEARAQTLGSFSSFASIKEARLNSVRQLAAVRFDWERFLRELALVLPEGSWLQSADASATGVPGSETSGTETQLLGPSAILTGCTPRQSDTARLMVRLRGLHRVTDVELGESITEPGSEAPTADSCGRYYKFEVTVEFETAPVPEAPRGSGRVPASLGGGS